MTADAQGRRGATMHPQNAHITTPAELDALPVGSVGRGCEGQTYTRYHAGWFGAGRLHPLDVSRDVSYPVTVLFRPDGVPANTHPADVLDAAADTLDAMQTPDGGLPEGIRRDPALWLHERAQSMREATR